MKRMLRSFLPIGQGAFYAEQFDNGTNVVYDCGSETSVRIVESMIRSTFENGETIHAVFISHMHNDHINGLEHLLTYCNVERIYLPYLTPVDKVLVLLDQTQGRKKLTPFSRNFVSDPGKAIEELQNGRDHTQTQLVFIPSPHDIEERGRDFEEANIQISQSGEPVSVNGNISYWQYVPFTFNNRIRRKQLLDALGWDDDNPADENQILKMMEDEAGRTKLKAAYKKVSSDLNTSTMTVYSGPSDVHNSYVRQYAAAFQHRANGCCGCACLDWQSAGCLYLGDYDAKTRENWNELDAAYDRYWNETGVIQVPHHGSQYNFNEALLSRGSFFVISAGYNNRHSHPHAKVLKSIMCLSV